MSYMINGNTKHVSTENTASVIHNPQAKSLAQTPHAGTQTKQNMLMIVARPMGKVPRNIDCAGWVTITGNMSGYIRYRRAVISRKTINNSTLKANRTTDIQ